MRLSGAATLPATPEQVWEFFNDPARLAKALPGCERLDPDGLDRYKAVIKFALAAISGRYDGRLELLEKKPPHSLRLKMEGKGLPGWVKGDGELKLTAKDGATEVSYAGEAQVGGMIASVGQRMIESAAKKIVHQFFETVAKLL